MNGSCFSYEGTGRSLSLKLIEQLRVQSRPMGVTSKTKEADAKLLGRTLAEVGSGYITVYFQFNWFKYYFLDYLG